LDGEAAKPTGPILPDTLAGWATFNMDAAFFRRLAQDNSVLAIAPNTLPECEVTLSYLDLLIRWVTSKSEGLAFCLTDQVVT
jgi:hypothetical protein